MSDAPATRKAAVFLGGILAMLAADLCLRGMIVGLLGGDWGKLAAGRTAGLVALVVIAAGSVIAKGTRRFWFSLGLAFLALALRGVEAAHDIVLGHLPASEMLIYIDDLASIWPSLNALLPQVTSSVAVAFTLFATISFFLPAVDANNVVKQAAHPLLLTLGVVPLLVWPYLNSPLPAPQPPKKALSVDEVRQWQKWVGLSPFASGQPDGLLCGSRAPPKPLALDVPDGKRPNLVLILVEGLGRDSLDAVVDGRKVLPKLNAMSGALRFDGMKSIGTKSGEALQAILAGIPAQTAGRLLHKKPLPDIQGIPTSLQQAGYQTAFFYGGELAFGQMDRFVKRSGFETIVGWGLEEHATSMWGLSDRDLFARAWNDFSEALQADKPLFLTVATVGTHHPYTLPDGTKRQFEGESLQMLEADAFAALDVSAAEFITKAVDNNSIVLLVGDHVSHRTNADRIQNEQPYDFDTPLLVFGLPTPVDDIEQRSAANWSHIDIGATIAHLADAAVPSCHQGLSVLGPLPSSQRVVYAVDHQLSGLYAWRGQFGVRADRKHGAFDFIAAPPATTQEQFNALAKEMIPFLQRTEQLSGTLWRHDAFAPSSRGDDKRYAQPQPLRVISHRGATRGVLPAEQQNRLASVERAFAAGFKWVEVDVSFSADGVPFLFHDRTVEVDGEKKNVYEVSWAQLQGLSVMTGVVTLETFLQRAPKMGLNIELKPPRHAESRIDGARRVVQLVHTLASDRAVVIDSFSPMMASIVARECKCESAVDAPFKQRPTTEQLREWYELGIDWVYLEHSIFDASLARDVRAAGLRPLVYTLNEPARLKEMLAGFPPDGVITDAAMLLGVAGKR